MTKDIFTISQTKNLVNEKRIIINKFSYTEEEFFIIREAVLNNIPLPIIYCEQDKYGVLYFNDKLTNILLDLLKKEFDTLSPKEQIKIEDYQFQVAIVSPTKIDLKNKEIVKKLTKLFNNIY